MARLLLKLGRKAESAEVFQQAARTLNELPTHSSGDWYNLACLQACVAARVGEGEPTIFEASKADRDRFIADAMKSLSRSLEGESVSAAHMRTDPDLEILRDRPDFRALVDRKAAIEVASAVASRAQTGTPQEKLNAGQQAIDARAANWARRDPVNLPSVAPDLAASQYALGQVLGDVDRFDDAAKAFAQRITSPSGVRSSRKHPAMCDISSMPA